MCYVMNCSQTKIGSFSPNIQVDYERIDKIKNRNIFRIKECRECDFQFLCGGGCPAYAALNGKDLMTPCCGLFKDTEILDALGEIVL